ncbi:MAG: SsrA-binding protein SmpB [Thermodesulfobacteriota bacterium]
MAKKKSAREARKKSPVIAKNKRAGREYEFLERLEAGIALTGSEIKSLRAGRISFKDAHVRFRSGEAFLVGAHIAFYENAGYAQHDPDRDRKLLLHKGEILNWMGKVEQKGLTIIPLSMYLSRGRVKVELALAKGKKLHDRREELKRRAIDRDTAREMKNF